MASIESEISKYNGHSPLRIENENGVLESSTDISALGGKIYYIHKDGKTGSRNYVIVQNGEIVDSGVEKI
jgi:hypothetical protein